MRELREYFCPNEQCENYGTLNKGNISIRGRYGKDKKRYLLYCRTFGKRFAPTQSSALFGLHLPAEKIRKIIHLASKGDSVRTTARLLDLDKDTVNRVILRVGEHCASVLADLLTSLEMSETQLDELWAFIKKKRVMAAMKASRASKSDRESGQPSTPSDV